MRSFFNHVKPASRCILCAEDSARTVDLCQPCEEDLPWIEAPCCQCALPLQGVIKGQQIRCGACQKHPPRFDAAFCPLNYQFPVDRLINRIKHQHQPDAVASLVYLMAGYISSHPAYEVPDCLMPVPLSGARQRQRSFNQAYLIAKGLAQTLKIPLDAKSLTKARETGSQQGLSAAQRSSNLRGAFEFTKDPSYTHVALVDDVMTTGATAETVAQLLKMSGVKRVQIWALARTPRTV